MTPRSLDRPLRSALTLAMGVGTVAIDLHGAPGADPRADPTAAERQDAPPRARASWRDRTREVAAAGGVSVRSDLSADRTATLAAAESAALRRLIDPWGQPRGGRRLWGFATRGAFEATLRTEFGGDARGREVVLVDHRGDRLVAVCDAGVAEDRLAHDLAAAIAERHLIERWPAASPWLRAALPAWFGEAMAYGGWHPGLANASRQESLAAAASAGRLIGVDRVIALDRLAWRANEAGGSGPLQEAEAVALLATLLGDPSDRSAGATGRRAAMGRWWRQVQSGTDPRRAWGEVFGVPLAVPVREAVESTMARSPSELERAIREARWLAEGRLHLEARGETIADPAEVRQRLLDSGFALEDACVAASGRCGWRPSTDESPVWSPSRRSTPQGDEPSAQSPSVDVWSGAVGTTLLEVRWTRSADGGWRYAIRIGG
ncbi:MAG: hypothetical protein ACO3Y3_13490 [Phycisphaerales bacterium]